MEIHQRAYVAVLQEKTTDWDFRRKLEFKWKSTKLPFHSSLLYIEASRLRPDSSYINITAKYMEEIVWKPDNVTLLVGSNEK